MSLYWRNGVHFLELSMHCYLKYILNYIKILVLNKIIFFYYCTWYLKQAIIALYFSQYLNSHLTLISLRFFSKLTQNNVSIAFNNIKCL